MKKLLIVGFASIILTGLVACKQNNATDQTMAPADQATATQPATPNAAQPVAPNAAQPVAPNAAQPVAPSTAPGNK